jgi:hypothetical protein
MMPVRGVEAVVLHPLMGVHRVRHIGAAGESKERMMRDYKMEVEIVEGKGGPLRPDESTPDFANEGICAWM